MIYSHPDIRIHAFISFYRGELLWRHRRVWRSDSLQERSHMCQQFSELLLCVCAWIHWPVLWDRDRWVSSLPALQEWWRVRDFYKAWSTSILIYLFKNLPIKTFTLTEKERLDAYQLKQLKKILNIRYPKKITNKSLYRICQEKPLSLEILSAHWSLFNHNYSTKRPINSCK